MKLKIKKCEECKIRYIPKYSKCKCKQKRKKNITSRNLKILCPNCRTDFIPNSILPSKDYCMCDFELVDYFEKLYSLRFRSFDDILVQTQIMPITSLFDENNKNEL